MTRKAVFLDRDGTICEEIGYCASPNQFRLLPRAAAAIRMINASGLAAVVVTNQSGIARGYFSELDLAAIHQKMRRDLAVERAYIDAIFYCHHSQEDDCECRKPRPGMLLDASRCFGISLSDSFLVGDASRDIMAANTAGCTGILLGETVATNTPCLRAVDLYDAVCWIVAKDSGAPCEQL